MYHPDYLTSKGIKKCYDYTTEAELNGADCFYGYGRTLLGFDYGYDFEDHCIHLSLAGLREWYRRTFKNPKINKVSSQNNDWIDFS